ncbi:unnamed protein product [Ceutorhynchus assimilis]|uniref:Uncharacterized protein n=1 Tax=Ceutorhynchus assimilis TaxID=467358 RepID=A0A9N9QRK9_9CUCU|nr:unnamed protein product [Ceutorhynchus assimilis]
MAALHYLSLISLKPNSRLCDSVKMYDKLPNYCKLSEDYGRFRRSVKKLLTVKAYYDIDEFFTGRPIVKANNYQSQTPDQFFAQLAAQQQPLPQQRTYQAVPTAPHRKPIIGQQYQQQQASQYGQSQQQYSHPNPQSFPSQPTAQQLRAQHQHRPTTTVQPQATPVGPAVQPQPQVQQPQGPPPQAATTTQKQPMGFQQQGLQQQQTNPLWQQFFNSAAQQNSRQAGHRSQQSGALSPSTADQLTRWFSPDLLERARVGDLPSTANLARLEEIERQAAAPRGPRLALEMQYRMVSNSSNFHPEVQAWIFNTLPNCLNGIKKYRDSFIKGKKGLHTSTADNNLTFRNLHKNQQSIDFSGNVPAGTTTHFSGYLN